MKKLNDWFVKHPRLNPLNFSINGTFRTLTIPLRTLPDFILVGFSKCGTHSLFSYVTQHPNIGIPSRKGKYYFDASYWRGSGWYKAHFPTSIYKNYFEWKHNEPYCVGEYSARYIMYYPTAQRIKELIPNVKFLVILRNPINRAYSSYNYKKSAGFEKMSFDEVVENDQERLENWETMVKNDKITRANYATTLTPYIGVGIYVKHLREWFKVFSQNQFLILQTETMLNEPQNITDKIFSFLGLPKYEIKNFTKKKVASYEKMNSKTREFLIDFYKPYNEELEKLLNMKFNWDE